MIHVFPESVNQDPKKKKKKKTSTEQIHIINIL